MAKESIWDQMRRIQEDMDERFDNLFKSTERMLDNDSEDTMAIQPYKQAFADVYETKKEIVTTIELPGVDKDEIHMNVRDNGIEIHAEKNMEVQDVQTGAYRKAKGYSGFYRFIPMPSNANTAEVDAEFKNGVLRIHMPKKKGNKSRAVTIN